MPRLVLEEKLAAQLEREQQDGAITCRRWMLRKVVTYTAIHAPSPRRTGRSRRAGSGRATWKSVLLSESLPLCNHRSQAAGDWLPQVRVGVRYINEMSEPKPGKQAP